jgi:calcium-dependent protein kinase
MVMKARDKQSGNEVAVKLINKSDTSLKSSEMINEVEILKTLDHPNVVKLLEIYEND